MTQKLLVGNLKSYLGAGGAAVGGSKLDPHIQRARRDQRRRQMSPDGWVMG